jgi:hypothetical protein
LPPEAFYEYRVSRLGHSNQRHGDYSLMWCFQAPALGSTTFWSSDPGGGIEDGAHLGAAYCDGCPHTDGAVQGIIDQETET